MDEKYKVYKVSPKMHYSGFALIGAHSAEEANRYIDHFLEMDLHNDLDSWGYDHVDEDDVIDDLWAEKNGFILTEIYYIG